MELFDNEIRKLYEGFKKIPTERIDRTSYELIQSRLHLLEKENLILKSDMAYELGGGFHEAIADMIPTTNRELVPDSEVVLIGKDLNQIHEDVDYARFLIVRFHEDYLEGIGEEDFYRILRKLSYLRYKMYMDGFMTRISSTKEREPIRVSKKALKQNLSLMDMGKLYIEKYLACDGVEAVKVIFVTEESANYAKMREIAKRCENITSSIDHILSGMIMDCSTCNLKEVCDEVEELREMHGKISGR